MLTAQHGEDVLSDVLSEHGWVLTVSPAALKKTFETDLIFKRF